jgi:putative FmdB family regulatory protein
MPFYEYECQACKFYTEVMQKITDAPLIKCPSCGKRRLQKLVSAPVFRLKGGGWYETDFKSDKESKRNLVGDKEEAKAESKPDKDAKADSKDAKEAKPAEAKPAESKREPAGSSRSARRVSLAGKGARQARKPARSAGKRGTRRGRR